MTDPVQADLLRAYALARRRRAAVAAAQRRARAATFAAVTAMLAPTGRPA